MTDPTESPENAGTAEPKKRSTEFWVAVIGSAAGIVAAIAAVAVFVVPTKDGRADGSTSTPRGAVTAPPIAAGSVTAAGSAGSTGSIGGSSIGSGGETRYLAVLTPTAGSGFIKIHGNDLRLTCPTNDSDDTYNEVTYALPVPFPTFSTQVTIAGQADQDATAGIQVFIQHREERSDREPEVGNPFVLPQGKSATLTSALPDDAVALTLRITCTSADQIVDLGSPLISRP